MSLNWFAFAVGVFTGIVSLLLLGIIIWSIFVYKMWERS